MYAISGGGSKALGIEIWARAASAEPISGLGGRPSPNSTSLQL